MIRRFDVLETAVNSETVRSTFYLESALHQGLRLKAAAAHRSMSDIVNEAIREALREDQEDLTTGSTRSWEPTLDSEQFLTQLKTDGTL
jgi:plasmid stability protein